MAASGAPGLRRMVTFEGLDAEEEERRERPQSGRLGGRKPVFINRKEMKDKLRADVRRPTFDVRTLYKDEGVCQRVSRSEAFETASMTAIALNALWISLEADLNSARTLVDAHPAFIVIENLFCLFFVVELLTRLFAFKRKSLCVRDRRFVFDSVMVALMVVETWIFTLVLWALRNRTQAVLSKASIVKSLRLLKLLRAARMARLLRTMPEILIIVKGMAAAVRSVVFTFLLLIMILYVFALTLRQIADGTEIGETWFATVPKTANQLVMKGMFFDDIGDLVNDMANAESKLLGVVLWLTFIGFVVFATLTVLNMLIGVLCDVVSAVGAVEREELTLSYIKAGIWPFVMPARGAVYDGDDAAALETLRLSKESFLDLLQVPEAAQALANAEVDLFSLVDMIDVIFTDEKGFEKALTFQELITVFMELRLSKKATTKDISDFRAHINLHLDIVDAKMELKLAAMQARIDALTPAIEEMARVPPGYVDAAVANQLGLLKEAAKNMRIHHMMRAFDGSPRSTAVLPGNMGATAFASKMVDKLRGSSGRAKRSAQGADGWGDVEVEALDVSLLELVDSPSPSASPDTSGRPPMKHVVGEAEAGRMPGGAALVPPVLAPCGLPPSSPDGSEAECQDPEDIVGGAAPWAAPASTPRGPTLRCSLWSSESPEGPARPSEAPPDLVDPFFWPASPAALQTEAKRRGKTRRVKRGVTTAH